uniref:BED-type domain-containing protein n=1 Tax=Oryza punctata TaxID=4537 RepID=A0A0E0MP05_ORYPU
MAPNVAVGGSNSMGNEGARTGLSEEIVDPSIFAASDQDTIAYLAKVRELLGTSKVVNHHLDGKRPSELPSCFLSSEHFLLTTAINSLFRQNSWTEVPGGFSAIRATTDDAEYMGAKKVLEFREQDGTRTGWIMVKYYLLCKRPNKKEKLSNSPFFNDGLVLCKVFQLKRPGPVRPKHEAEQLPTNQAFEVDIFYGLEAIIDLPADVLLPGEKQRNTHTCSRGGSCCNKSSSRGASSEEQPTKRHKPSNVWEHFTRIYTSDPKVVYAACHCCDRLFSGHSSNGTSHLRKHAESCTGKHLLQFSVLQPLRRPMEGEGEGIGGVPAESANQPAGLNADAAPGV